jgi:1-acyl-sn-glycerol-3-phosphate acyltransferase
MSASETRSRKGRDGGQPGERKDPPKPMRDDISPFIRGMTLAARTALRGLTRPQVKGALDRIPRTGALIIAGNHLSNADGVLIGGWLTPALGRRIHWLGKREMVEWPVIGLLARAGSVHPVDRGTADMEAFRVAQRILEEGHVLLIFPEGTRSPTGALQEAKDGLAMLALRTGATILPVGVAGTDRFWPRGGVPRPGGRIRLVVGEPFRLADVVLAGLDRRATKSAATRVIMTRIAALLPPRHRGAYADAVAEMERAAAEPGPVGEPPPASEQPSRPRARRKPSTPPAAEPAPASEKPARPRARRKPTTPPADPK